MLKLSPSWDLDVCEPAFLDAAPDGERGWHEPAWVYTVEATRIKRRRIVSGSWSESSATVRRKAQGTET